MRAGRAGPAVLLAAVAACSASEEPGPPAASADEQRALAEARAMIPADEIAALPRVKESSRP